MTKGWIIRFGITTNNPYFKERFNDSDPKSDFSKKCKAPRDLSPHWCICEPIVRKHIQTGDRIFFVKKGTYNVKGVLTVKHNDNEQGAKKKLGEEWAEFHKREVCTHTGLPRSGNIIIGDAEQSFYLTGDGIDLHSEVFGFSKDSRVLDRRMQRNSIPKFTDDEQGSEQVSRLYKELKKRRP